MKKHQRLNAFTLAETLVTLMVIGVIAVMTIPTLKDYSDEVKYVTAAKKAFASVTAATAAVETKHSEASLWLLTNPKTIKWYKEVVNAIPNPDPEHPSWGIASLDPNDGLDDHFTPTLWTADGMAWMFRPYDNCPTKGGWVLVDTNGAKQPNTRGIDIHVFLVGHKTCKSAGFGVYAAGDGCNAPNTHYACTVYAVTEGKMPWFREPGRYTGCAPFQQSEQKCPRFE